MSNYEDRERKGPPAVDHMFTLKVGNLHYKTTKEQLQDEFGSYGDVGDVYVPRDFRTQEPKGYSILLPIV